MFWATGYFSLTLILLPRIIIFLLSLHCFTHIRNFTPGISPLAPIEVRMGNINASQSLRLARANVGGTLFIYPLFNGLMVLRWSDVGT